MPVAVLNVPAVVGHCDSVTLNAGTSFHSGGRDLSFTWNVDVTPTRDESGAVIYTCVDDGFALDSSTCLDQDSLMSYIVDATCGDALAGNLQIGDIVIDDCGTFFCPTCSFQHMCDASCGFCSHLDGVEEDCAATVEMIKQTPIVGLWHGCDVGEVCEAFASNLPYLYSIYVVAPDAVLSDSCLSWCKRRSHFGASGATRLWT